jgi:glycosyltransferase involved in cell wall biosynthesis
VRIEYVLPSLGPAGMEMVVADLSLTLHARGHHIGVTCTQSMGALAERLAHAGISVRFVPLRAFVDNLLAMPLRETLRDARPDVVHSHCGAWQQAAVAASCFTPRPLVVHTIHGMAGIGSRLRARWRNRAGAALSDAIVTVSDALRIDASGALRIAQSRFSTIPNGVDVERFCPIGTSHPLREVCSIPSGAFVFGMVGRFVPVKAHHLMLNAFAAIQRSSGGHHLAIVGDGPLRTEVQQLATSLGIQSSVHFLGPLDDPAPFYRSIDAFVLPSFSEGTSVALLEALACGVPTVATAVGGTPAVVGDSAALLAEGGDLLDLIEKLRAVSDPGAAEMRSQLAQSARERVVQSYGLDAMATEYERLYNALLKTRARGYRWT